MNAYKKYVFTGGSEKPELDWNKRRGGTRPPRLGRRVPPRGPPVVSAGATWFEEIEEQWAMELVSATAYSNGVVGLYYAPA